MGRKSRGNSGVSLVEFAAALVFGLPLVFSVLYAVIEANYLFTIRTNLDMATRNVARAIAKDAVLTAYTPADCINTNGSRSHNIETQFNIPHFVTSDPAASQWSNVVFETTQHPYTVTVSCRYPTGGYAGNNEMPFPWPDPLKLGSTFQVTTTATFPIGGE